eukprot:TRINITY_DN8355_c0_g1_i5.p1 TRINITY_DN8355_c0_g1~~TRINITY_DN8355_c0_g1_i5.p1  ORF type:complete len:368 (+),score=77.73 TRINITY_DN8355_c0_g1_i5:76-1179(+)
MADYAPGNAKTVLCKYWDQGTCTKGDSCTFAHGDGDLRGTYGKGGKSSGKGKAPPQKVYGDTRKRPADDDMGGDYKRQNTQTVPGYKTQMCAFFPVGKCAKGNACTYAHHEWELTGGSQPQYEAAPAPSNGSYHRAPPPAARPVGPPPGHWDAAPSPASWTSQAAGTPHNFKTVICKYWEQGTCTKGRDCTFAHGAHDTGSSGGGSKGGKGGGKAAGKMQIPKAFEPAQPAYQPSGDDAAKYKTKMCNFFLEGRCTKGDDCTFAHDESELAAAPPRSAPKGAEKGKGGKGSSFKGTGKVGTNNNPYGIIIPSMEKDNGAATGAYVDAARKSDSRPSNYKSVLCTHFENGDCRRGEACSFAHGEEELQ